MALGQPQPSYLWSVTMHMHPAFCLMAPWWLALTAGAASAADIAAGKARAEICVGCHGANGISQIGNIPSLAGQPDQFIQWQLVYFRAGSRKNAQMQLIMEDITNEDIRNLGAYFASLAPPKPPAQDDNADLSKKGANAAVGAPLRLMPYRRFCWHQGGGPPRRPARGLSFAGAARLQIRRACRRPGRDGRRRLSAERRGNRSARTLSCASLNVVVPGKARPRPERRRRCCC